MGKPRGSFLHICGRFTKGGSNQTARQSEFPARTKNGNRSNRCRDVRERERVQNARAPATSGSLPSPLMDDARLLHLGGPERHGLEAGRSTRRVCAIPSREMPGVYATRRRAGGRKR